MVKDKHVIKIGIDDWVRETIKEEPTIASEQDIIGLVTEHGEYNTSTVARMALASRHLGISPEHLLLTDKFLLLNGAASQIGQMIANQKKKVMLENGKEVKVRSYVGRPMRKESEEVDPEDCEIEFDETEEDKVDFVASDTEAGAKRAYKYLMSVVVGHIRNRLTVLATNGEDLHEIAQELKDKIDVMVEKLS